MAITERITKLCNLFGAAPIMFDRYAGDNATKLSPDQKLYLDEERNIVLPALNVLSFLTAINTESAPKLLLDPKRYQKVCSALLSSVTIQPDAIPFLRKGKPITFGAFDASWVDKKSGVQVLRHVARLAKGIPNAKERPMLPLPWELTFTLSVAPHPELAEDQIAYLFSEGGSRIGLGTFRKAFGKFTFAWKDV